MELIIIISLEITGIKLLPKIREFNDFFLEMSAERHEADGRVLRRRTQRDTRVAISVALTRNT